MTTFKALNILALFVVTAALVPIPPKEVGFVYKSSSTNVPVNLDFYIDQLCPYSKAAWPTILKVADTYGPSKLKLTTHLFPLPYHRNSFYASKGSHIVDQMTSGHKTYDWIQAIFDRRGSIVGSQTFTVPDNLIVMEYASIANTSLSLNSTDFLYSMLTSQEIEMDTRIGWKYCCSRGVSGTPTFMINDVTVDASSEWNVTDWKTLIDPLLA